MIQTKKNSKEDFLQLIENELNNHKIYQFVKNVFNVKLDISEDVCFLFGEEKDVLSIFNTVNSLRKTQYFQDIIDTVLKKVAMSLVKMYGNDDVLSLNGVVYELSHYRVSDISGYAEIIVKEARTNPDNTYIILTHKGNAIRYCPDNIIIQFIEREFNKECCSFFLMPIDANAQEQAKKELTILVKPHGMGFFQIFIGMGADVLIDSKLLDWECNVYDVFKAMCTRPDLLGA